MLRGAATELPCVVGAPTGKATVGFEPAAVPGSAVRQTPLGCFDQPETARSDRWACEPELSRVVSSPAPQAAILSYGAIVLGAAAHVLKRFVCCHGRGRDFLLERTIAHLAAVVRSPAEECAAAVDAAGRV